jgi:hypothetical protein
MIYQHATDERDRRIADGLNLMIEAALNRLPSHECRPRRRANLRLGRSLPTAMQSDSRYSLLSLNRA